MMLVLFSVIAYAIGKSEAHKELLQQCKGEKRGIELHVRDKRYFYYCSYTPQGER
jgi:hypothetical protein